MTVAELKALAEKRIQDDNYPVTMHPAVVAALCDVAESGQQLADMQGTADCILDEPCGDCLACRFLNALAALDEAMRQ